MVTRPRKARPKKPDSTTQAEAFRRVVEAGGIDPATVDPRRILAGIAADPDAPAGARVQACKTLLGARGDAAAAGELASSDELTRRALALLTTGKAN
jgi:hypothetical protein